MLLELEDPEGLMGAPGVAQGEGEMKAEVALKKKTTLGPRPCRSSLLKVRQVQDLGSDAALHLFSYEKAPGLLVTRERWGHSDQSLVLGPRWNNYWERGAGLLPARQQ